jgi:hypothetical protein
MGLECSWLPYDSVETGLTQFDTHGPCYVDIFDGPCVVLHCPREARLLRPTAIIMATLFTGVSSSIISEHVLEDRFDMKKVDATKRQELQFTHGALVETLAQVTFVRPAGNW